MILRPLGAVRQAPPARGPVPAPHGLRDQIELLSLLWRWLQAAQPHAPCRSSKVWRNRLWCLPRTCRNASIDLTAQFVGVEVEEISSEPESIEPSKKGHDRG